MEPDLIGLGKAAWLQTGQRPDGSPAFHLYIVITKAHKPHGNELPGAEGQPAVLIVNLTGSRNQLQEPIPVVIQKGQDQRVTKDSQVAYTKAILATVQELQHQTGGKVYTFNQCALHRIRQGMDQFVKRKECPAEIKNFYLDAR